MDRRAVGKAARRAFEGLSIDGAAWSTRVRDALSSTVPNCLPKKTFPGYPSAL
jgi:hypothetical protein